MFSFGWSASPAAGSGSKGGSVHGKQLFWVERKGRLAASRCVHQIPYCCTLVIIIVHLLLLSHVWSWRAPRTGLLINAKCTVDLYEPHDDKFTSLVHLELKWCALTIPDLLADHACFGMCSDSWLGHAKTYNPPLEEIVEKYQDLFHAYEECSSSLRQIFKKLANFRESS